MPRHVAIRRAPFAGFLRLDSGSPAPYVPSASGTPPMGLLRHCNVNAFFKREKPPTRVIMAKTKFRPLHDRVVVKCIDAEAKSKGGIIIPDTAKEKPSEGEVVAVGPG